MKVYDVNKNLGFSNKAYSSLIPVDGADMMFKNLVDGLSIPAPTAAQTT